MNVEQLRFDLEVKWNNTKWTESELQEEIRNFRELATQCMKCTMYKK